MKLAKIEDGQVIDIIIADSMIDGFIEIPDDVNAGIGFSYDGDSFIDNREFLEYRKTIYSKFSFKKLFTATEWAAIKSSSDPLIMSFVEDFEIADYMDLDHSDMIQGLDYLESEGIISSGRADEIRGI